MIVDNYVWFHVLLMLKFNSGDLLLITQTQLYDIFALNLQQRLMAFFMD